jgi:hypothetical protein
VGLYFHHSFTMHVPRPGTMFLLDTTFRFGFGLEHGCYATWLCLAFEMFHWKSIIELLV